MAVTNIRSALQQAIEHHQAGRLPQAEELYRAILARDPRCADAVHLSGVAALQGGRGEAAVELIRRAVKLAPRRADFHANLGEAYRTLARPDEAVASLRQALKLQPDFPVALNCLGVVLAAQRQVDDAQVCYQKALRFEPNYADAHHNLGNLWADRGQPEKAEACFRRALALKPDSAAGHNGLGNALLAQYRLEEAIAAYRRALVLNPGFAEAHNNLGSALCERGEFEEALAFIQQAIAHHPGLAAAYSNRGNVLVRQGRLDEAETSFRQAIALRPDYADAHNNLGGVFKERGQLEEALACHRQAIALRPNHAEAHSNVILGLLYQAGNEAGPIEAELRRWNRQHAAPLAASMVPPVRPQPHDARLRVGYVSGDFTQHSVAFFLLPLLEAHDRAGFHIIGYSTNPRPDAVTARFQACADEWRNLAGKPGEAVARQIREDQVDLLVDLSGHTAGNRLLVFARKPAPIQVSYLGFPDDTGLEAIDCRLTDHWADPPTPVPDGATGRVVRLPGAAWCFTPLSGSQPVSAPPVAARGCVTFGCFNNFAKVTGDMLRLWARILQQTPGSRLVLKNLAVGNTSVVRRLQDFFAQHGLGADRIEFVPRAPSPLEHLLCYNRVDIALDTFPYHGTTTTCEALWMGVPVITLAGVRHVARVGVSLLTNVGLPEYVTHDPDAYVRTAVALGSDRPRLEAIRASLRGRMLASPLMDAPRLARQVEAAYRTLWQNRGEQSPAGSIP